jgi:hypothetical protein
MVLVCLMRRRNDLAAQSTEPHMNIREPKVSSAPQASMVRITTIAVLSCYLVSFILPTINDHGQVEFHQKGSDVVLGWGVFCQVILNLPFSATYLPAWFANCILCSGLLAFIDGRLFSARISARLCVVLALSALLASRSDAHWLTILNGYYVWLLSMVMFLVGSEVIGISARRSSNRGFEAAHGIEPMSLDASHSHLPIEPAAGGFARQIALGLWILQVFATALAVLSAMGDVTTIIGTGILTAIIGLALSLVAWPIHSRLVSLFGLSAPLLFICCVVLFAWSGAGPKQAAVPIRTILVLYALFALPAAVIARRHILRWSRSEEPTGWQFSLKSLLIGVTVLAVVFACVGTIFYKNANGIAKPAPDDKAKRHLRIATTPHFDVHLQSKDVEIKGWVDTTTNTFTIASWHDTNKVSWTQAWTPQAKELPLVLLAYKQDGTPFDVPEDWDGQLSGFAFLLPADQDLLSVMWNEGTPTPFWKGASFGWGGLRNSAGQVVLADRTRFRYLPHVDGGGTTDLNLETVAVTPRPRN